MDTEAGSLAADCFKWKGTIGRGRYTKLGLILFFLKYNLDRAVAGVVFGRQWFPLTYLFPSMGGKPADSPMNDPDFFITMVVMALPFIAIGVGLTLRRLRSAGLPEPLVFLFFVPFVNLVFFALLCMLPPKLADGVEAGDSALARFIPRSKWGSGLMGLFVTALMVVLLTILSVKQLERYGWGLFVGIPFFAGLNSSLLYCYHERRSMKACLAVAFASIVLSGNLLIGLAFEGIICIMMAAPFAIPLALFGGLVGYLIQDGVSPRRGHAVFCLPALLPFAMALEKPDERSTERQVVSSIFIEASPETVWRNVVEFSELPPPAEWIFATGIAYPTKATIDGRGPGAIRRCEFSTGAFVEPIEVWDEPKLLRFNVIENPPTMHELNPFGRVTAPHLNDFFRSKQGEFRLSARDGGTLLEGATRYTNRIWPVAYWGPISDWIVSTIHLRVLRHIKGLSEKE